MDISTGKPASRKPARPRLRDPRLKWRGATIYCWVPDPGGKTTPSGKPLTVLLSTFARDEEAAVAKTDEYERKALSPAFRASLSSTLATAVEDYCAFMLTMESKAHPGQRIKPETVEKIQREKMGMLLKYAEEKGFPGGEMPLHRVDSEWVDGYIAWRSKHKSGRTDGSNVGNYNIKRELGYLKSVLGRAKRQSKYSADLEKVFPTKEEFSGACRRVERYPSREETTLILANLRGLDGGHSPERAAHIAFLIATGARLKESVLARRGDVDFANMVVRFGAPRGKRDSRNTLKTVHSASDIPITPVMEPILRWVLEAAPGKGEHDRLFLPWRNPSHQIARVCKRLGIDKYSVHDFRRAFTHLHLDAGIDYSNASAMLRHGPGGSKLVESTYGRIRQASRIAARVAPQMTNTVSLPMLPSAVRTLSVPQAVSMSQESTVSLDSAGESPIAEDSAALLCPVHGRGAGSAEVAGIVTDAAAFLAGAVRGLSGHVTSSDKAALPLADAVATLARFIGERVTNEAERAVLAQALAALHPHPEAAE